MTSEEQTHRQKRFARIRRVKWLLRFLPRRAVFHKYPLVGRFAAMARKRSYLWSFKTQYVRPAFYAGSILALLPTVGVQLPAALILSLVFRLNFMVVGGLQFITNPVTAIPIYTGTYKLGEVIIKTSGLGHSIPVVEPSFDFIATTVEEQAAVDPAPAPPKLKWTRRIGSTVNALIIGGLVTGSALGFVLDLAWRYGVKRTEVHRIKVLVRKARSDSTPPFPPTQ